MSDENMNRKETVNELVSRKVKRVMKFVLFGVVAITVFGFVVRFLWNWLMPPIFGLHPLTFWQALGLLALCWILFGGMRGGPGHHRRRHFRERWEAMTPEQRDKIRSGTCGPGRDFTPPPAAEQKA